MNRLRIGDRVRITESQHVCAYLHGSTGTITDIADAKPWESTVFGPLLYRIALDVPVAPTPHWTPLNSSILTAQDRAQAEEAANRG